MEDNMKVEEVDDIITQMVSNDKTMNSLFAKIDDAVNCRFVPDAAIANLPFVQGRQFALTDIADARNAGARTFSSLLPNINISPTADNEGEYERVEKMETAWGWEMEKMNMPLNGKKGVHDLIVESAVTYHRVCLQTEYLPHKFKGNMDARAKAILARKSFNGILHHPSSVHAMYSDYGLEHVGKEAEYTALQLMENFANTEGAEKMRMELGSKKRSELMNIRYILRDYTNTTHRVIYAKAAGSTGASKGVFTFLNEKHDMPFIPWVIVDYGDPLWSAVIGSGHWNNLQHMKLIKFGKSMAMAGKPDYAIISQNGEMRGVWVDWSNPLNPLSLPTGTQLQDLRENKLDPQFETEYQEDRRDVARSTVSKLLQDTSDYVNAPFSTLNASINVAMGQLAPAKRTAEQAWAEVIRQGFEWIKFSGIPFQTYRKSNKDNVAESAQAYARGGAIIISPDNPPTEEEYAKMSDKELALQSQTVYFDVNGLYINVDLQSANMTDEQARLNVLINAIDKLGMSRQEAFERMGWKNFNMVELQRARETLTDAELQKETQMVMLEVQNAQMQMQAQQQQAMMQQQQAAQQPPADPTAQQNAGSQFAMAQGMDARGGGNPPTAVAPNENRVSITGQADNGQPVL